jgi:hypothetical protein
MFSQKKIPATSLSFIFTGLDYDLYQAEETDRKNTLQINQALQAIRKNL